MPVVPPPGTQFVRYALRALPYVANPFIGGNLNPAFPVARMAELRAYRRSTPGLAGVDDVTFAIDLGADVEVAAITLELPTFAAAQLTSGTTAVPAPGAPIAETQPGSGLVDCSSADLEDGRTKVLVLPPA